MTPTPDSRAVAAPPPTDASAPSRLRLRLMGTSDLHANIFPYDYYRDRPDDSVGLARTAGLIAAARETGGRGLRLVEENRGALARTLEMLTPLIDKVQETS